LGSKDRGCGGPQDFENWFDVFFPITSFSSENLSFPLVNPREIGKLGMFCYFFGGFVQAVCLNLGHPQNSSRENTSFSDTHPNQEWFKITGIPD